jgi:hypothetical protein
VNRQKFWHLVEEKKPVPNQENEPTHPSTAGSLRYQKIGIVKIGLAFCVHIHTHKQYVSKYLPSYRSSLGVTVSVSHLVIHAEIIQVL